MSAVAGDFAVEYSKSNRSKCKICKEPISKDVVRLAKYFTSPHHDGVDPHWHHYDCFFKKFTVVDSALLKGYLDLKPNDQERIDKKCSGGNASTSAKSSSSSKSTTTSSSAPKFVSDVPPEEYFMDYAASGRSTCQTCNEKIEKDAIRLGKMGHSDRFAALVPRWNHIKCSAQADVLPDLTLVSGYKKLRAADKVEVLAIAGQTATTPAAPQKKRQRDANDANDADETDANDTAQDYSALSYPALKKLCKERELVSTGTKAVLISRLAEADASMNVDDNADDDGKAVKDKSNTVNSEVDEKAKQIALYEQQLKDESKLRWEVKATLSHLNLNHLKYWLSENNVSMSGGRDVLVDAVIEGLLYGSIPACSTCSQYAVRFQDGMYKCTAKTEWSTCPFVVEVVNYEEFIIPADIEEELDEKILTKLKKNPPIKPLAAHRHHAEKGRQIIESREKKSQENIALREEKAAEFRKSHLFSGLSFMFYGKLSEDAKKEFSNRGGKLVEDTENNECDAFITDEKTAKSSRANAVKSIRDDKIIPMLNFSFVIDTVSALSLPDVVNPYVLINNAEDLQQKIDKIKQRIATKSGIEMSTAKSGSSLGSRSGTSKSVKVKVKGRGVVHEESGLVDTAHIYCSGNDVYSATLSSTDIARNTNSFYILQLIEDDTKQRYHVFRKWGRVGTTIGGTKIVDHNNLPSAKHEFETMFLEKSGNNWANHLTFVKQPGYMNLVDNEWTDENDADAIMDLTGSISKRDPRVIELIRALFDVNVMKQQLSEMEIDTEKMPLGRLSKAHIQQGYKALTDLQTTLQLPDTNPTKAHLLLSQSNQFYTLIPHDFGTAKPTIINSTDLLKQKLEIVDALLQMEIATNILKKEETTHEVEKEDPIDIHYRKLMADIEPINMDTELFKNVNSYLQTTHASTHRHYSLELVDLFSLSRHKEEDRFNPFAHNDNRKLLWHGSRRTNFVGIISQGLRIAPPEAPATGYMFGKGVYFADSSSKSANYCFTSRENNIGFMLLCEVALGKEYELHGAQYMDKAPKGYLSTKGCGRSYPNPKEYIKLENGAVMPSGKLITASDLSTSLLYNEFIVYDVSQICIRYMLKVRFNYDR